MSYWLPTRALLSLGLGVRRENEGEESGGLGTAGRPRSRNGSQRSGPSAGTMLGFIPHSFPPRKRGPRSRGGAAGAERTAAQWVVQRNDGWLLSKDRNR